MSWERGPVVRQSTRFLAVLGINAAGVFRSLCLTSSVRAIVAINYLIIGFVSFRLSHNGYGALAVVVGGAIGAAIAVTFVGVVFVVIATS